MEQKKQSKIKRRLLHSGLTILVLLAVLAVNIGFTVLSEQQLLRLDMSGASYNEISDESRALLDELNAEENNITIYFLADADELRNTYLDYSNTYYKNLGYDATTSLWGMKYVYDIALEFANQYDFISVKHLHLTKDAEELEVFRSTVGTTLTKQDVIIDNYTSEKDEDGNDVLDENGDPVMHHNFRIVKRDTFFVFDSDTSYVYGFQGDLRFTANILSLAGANPTVYFVTGHGEPVGDYTTGEFSSSGDYGEAQELRDLFFDAGFTTKKIDLTKEYETLFSDESARILVIYGPETDYAGEAAVASGGVNEIAMIRHFLVQEDHHLMAFLDDTKESLTNLESYLYDYWGVAFEDALIKDSGKNSLSDDGKSFLGVYETDEYSVGINLTNQLTELDSQPRAAFVGARPLTLDPSFTQSIGYSEMYASLVAGAVFLAPEGTSLVAADGSAVSEEDQGGAILAALTYESLMNEENDEVVTYVFTCGGTGFASNELLGSNTYANRDVLYYTMRLMSRDTVPFEIDFKVMDSEGLDDITETEALSWTIILCSLIPAGSLVIGTVVFIKRRHS
ncbi:MAG: hypothetical protein IJX76_01955 [Clostridia bacterium]|nr:hypothetical protein [Clostridia bacterium]